MKKVCRILIVALILLVGYNLFLFMFPLKKKVFYTNEEMIEEFVYTDEIFDNIIVGSSLSGAFQHNVVLDEKYYLLNLPYTGACTGLDVINRCGKVPKKLFLEINHVARGIDSSLMNTVFAPPFYTLRFYMPSLQTKNKILNNLIDRVKTPNNNKINESRPSDELYGRLLKSAQEKWAELGDTLKLNDRLNMVRTTLKIFSAKGCRIYLYEIPMDSSLVNTPLIEYQRNYFQKLASQEKYVFIPLDRSRTYQTGDGEHLLQKDADIYTLYFKSETSKD